MKVISYVYREKPDMTSVVNPSHKPVSFVITQFHIIFVYKENFTILSCITQEVIHAKTFTDSLQIKSSMFDIYDKYLLVLTKSADGLEYSQIQDEDKDAWTQYLKKGQIKQALEQCTSTQEAFVSGIYAD